MQLIAGRPAQSTSIARIDPGSSWKIVHATTLEADEHLHRWLAYIDLNKVRARVVNYPAGWEHSGYREIRYPPRNHTELSILRR